MNLTCADFKMREGKQTLVRDNTIALYREIDSNIEFFYNLFVERSKYTTSANDYNDFNNFLSKVVNISACVNVDRFLPKLYEVVETLKIKYNYGESKSIFTKIVSRSTNTERNQVYVGDYKNREGKWRDCSSLKDYQCNDECYFQKSGSFSSFFSKGTCKPIDIKDMVIRSYCADDSYRSTKDIIDVIRMFGKGKNEEKLLKMDKRSLCAKLLKIFNKNIRVFKNLSKDNQSNFWNKVHMDSLDIYKTLHIANDAFKSKRSFKQVSKRLWMWLKSKKWIAAIFIALIITTLLLYTYRPEYFDASYFTSPFLKNNDLPMFGPQPQAPFTPVTPLVPTDYYNIPVQPVTPLSPNYYTSLFHPETYPYVTPVPPTTPFNPDTYPYITPVEEFVKNVTGTSGIVDRIVTAEPGVDIDLLKRLGVDLREAAGDDGVLSVKEYQEALKPFFTAYTEFPNILQVDIPPYSGNTFDELVKSFSELSEKATAGTASPDDISKIQLVKDTIASMRLSELDKTGISQADYIMQQTGATIKDQLVKIGDLVSDKPGTVKIYDVIADKVHLENVQNLSKAYISGKIPEVTTTAIPVIKETINGQVFYYLTDPANTKDRIEALAALNPDITVPVIVTDLPKGTTVSYFLGVLIAGTGILSTGLVTLGMRAARLQPFIM